ncbi:ribonuclease H-like domain-containing protein [Tanacetum coccineum]
MGDHGNFASLMRDMLEKSSSSVAGTSEGHAHGHGYGTEEFDGCTLLHLPCETANVGMIELLLQYGANINVFSSRGRQHSIIESSVAKLHVQSCFSQGTITTKEKVQKKNDIKARSMLLMALPNEHLITFNPYKDAKTFDPSTESLDSIFNKLQKIVSQLAIFGENISQEDLNLKILRSLPSEWNTHVVVWRNKLDLDTMSFDDLYNNFKIVE